MANLRKIIKYSSRKYLLASCFIAFSIFPIGSFAQNINQTSNDAPLVPLLKTEERQLLITAVDGPLRIAKNRDIYRHPVETLEFFGVRPSDTVIEIWPGQGWYTSILAPYLKTGNGHLIAAHFDTSTTNSPIVQQVVDSYSNKFAQDPADFGNVSVVPFGPQSNPLGPDDSVDKVLTFRNTHNWMAQGWAEKAFSDFYKVLKPGGILGLEEHRQDESVPQDPVAADGYVREDFIIDLATEAGFELVAKSEINANPKDTKDHPFGVWTLPPVSRSAPMGQPENPNFDKRPYLKIGESDRMTLVFRKPIKQTPIMIAKSIPEKIANGVRMFGPGSKNSNSKKTSAVANTIPAKIIAPEPEIITATASTNIIVNNNPLTKETNNSSPASSANNETVPVAIGVDLNKEIKPTETPKPEIVTPPIVSSLPDFKVPAVKQAPVVKAKTKVNTTPISATNKTPNKPVESNKTSEAKTPEFNSRTTPSRTESKEIAPKKPIVAVKKTTPQTTRSNSSRQNENTAVTKKPTPKLTPKPKAKTNSEVRPKPKTVAAKKPVAVKPKVTTPVNPNIPDWKPKKKKN